MTVYLQKLNSFSGTLAILIQSGLGFKRTLLLNLFPNSLSYLGFIIGVLIGNMDDSYGNYIFAASSGMYLYVFLGTLVSDSNTYAKNLSFYYLFPFNITQIDYTFTNLLR